MILTGTWLLQAALRATLLLSLLWLVLRILPATRPALRRTVLLTAAALVLSAPWWSGAPATAIHLPTFAVFSNSLAPNRENALPFPQAPVLSWQTQALLLPGMVWLCGTLVLALRLILHAKSLHALIRQARPWSGTAPLPGWTLLHSSAVSGPCVARRRHPVLLLPDSARHWNDAQWRMVLTHEQQHLRQADLLLSWLPRLVICLYWWHPLSHWLGRQYHAESEALCDHAVLQRSGHSARDYTEFLLQLDASRLPAHAPAMPLKSPLGLRLQRLLRPDSRHLARPALLGILLLFSTLTAVILSLTFQPSPPETTAAAAPVFPPSPASPPAGEASLRLAAQPFPADSE